MKRSIAPITAAQYLSGKVRRWHTCVGMEQNLADHSHGVAFIIAMLHPNPSPNLLKAALFDDLGEYRTGDLPSPIKQDPELRDRIKALETDARHSMGIPDVPLTDEEHHWLAFADAYEAYMFINYVAQNGPSLGNIEHQMVEAKINKNAEALGIRFDADLIRQRGNGAQLN